MRMLVAAMMLLASFSAAYSKSLIIYTDRQERLVVFLVAAFEVATGVKAEVVYGDPSDLLERYKQAGRLPFDVVLTKDVGALAPLAERLLAPIESKAVAARVPVTYRDPAKRWVGVSRRTRAIYVSAERVPAGSIRRYEDLADPKWKGRLCSRPLSHSYNQQLIAAMIAEKGGQAAMVWLEGLSANFARSPAGSDRAQIKLVAQGVCDIALANSYYRGVMLSFGDQAELVAKTRIVLPTFRDSGGFVMLSAAAILRGAERPKEALAFVEFLTSNTAQRIMMHLVFEHPIAPATKLAGLVAEWGEIPLQRHSVSDAIAARSAASLIVDYVSRSAELRAKPSPTKFDLTGRPKLK
ncbi:MAG: extracellular solute-binding protein [Neomegalonema sp.]|nr:extracellular solute-binding protein [Neomegalonema sp.]